jgi:hypothetical protein
MEKLSTTRPSPSKANRRDHYLPQSYLRGFIDPERTNHRQPLWHFDIPNEVWSERSPREVGYRYGFYDYVTSEIGLETADNAFSQLENTFPIVRRELVSSKFANWKSHRDFLLRYIQMMRARSLLFFEHQETEGKNLRALTIEEISPDRRSVRVRSMTPEPLPDTFIRNWTITQMRTEIQKGSAWLNDFNWALRYCETPATPFVVSEIPFLAYGPHSDLVDALRDPESLLFFPLCWQACLIGSRQFFGIETDKFGDEDMRTFRKMYRASAKLFLLSPRQLDFS